MTDSDDSIVVPQQDEITAALTASGWIRIASDSYSGDPDSEQRIDIHPSYVPALCAALTRLAAEAQG